MAEYFFELLTEEIPAWMLRIYYGSVLDKLKEHLQMMLLQVGGLSDVSKHVIVTSTPRRIVIFLPQIPNQELDQGSVRHEWQSDLGTERIPQEE